ncbi:hypothetical protein FB566_2362 [Stackebrandtia endophytica]|uniref:Uncharacterized protein n=1 Tax=Stackebrandtia endophytica TaxID=1496996 RepID=A0A543AW88_9ACTN|nr:hypothetical protein [Stackebrandtia endophytica]TQL76822.1 hypothetical protein FB566_2362 [Stackebrandtia endophytica]
MIKVCLIGSHAELQTMVAHLATVVTVAATSRPYPAYTRRNGRRVIDPGKARIYLEIKR